VREYCDRAVLIEKSELVLSGNAETVAGEYTKMFIEEAKKKDADESKEKTVRWGTKTMTYTDAKVTVTDDKIIVEARAQAKRAANNANLGFSIKDATGHTLLGTNSQIKRVPIKDLKAGAKVSVRWTFPNIFKDDTYTLDLAAQDKDGEVWDWWEDVKSFKVLKEEKTPFRVNPRTELEVRIDE
jgi:lipopolysaccharide transport system ATP-binding protein